MATSDGMKWGEGDRFRDQILHANTDPDDEWDPAYVEALRAGTLQQYVQDVQAPSAYSVTSGLRNELVFDDSEPEVLCGERRPRTAGRCEIPARLHKPGAHPFYDQHIGRDTAGRWHIWPTPPPSDRGHGECECGDCSGWTWAWTEWATSRG